MHIALPKLDVTGYAKSPQQVMCQGGLKQQSLTILLVEQNVQQALKISDRAYILDQGEIVFHDTAQNLLNNDEIQQKYCAV
jgi:ABC-type branched-subunit amino acid transport system ATPase component